MDASKDKKFYAEWWHIRKSTIITVVTVAVIGGAAIGGYSWASRNNWFVPDQMADVPKDAARIVSFEGEVRITRAATRETVLVTIEPYVAAGDTIQTQSDGRVIVQMIDGSRYSVRPNSTIVVKDTTSLFGGKNVRVLLDDGQLNVRTYDKSQDARNIVEVGDSKNQLVPKTTSVLTRMPERTAVRSASAAAGSRRLSEAKNPLSARMNLHPSTAEKSRPAKNCLPLRGHCCRVTRHRSSIRAVAASASRSSGRTRGQPGRKLLSSNIQIADVCRRCNIG